MKRVTDTQLSFNDAGKHVIINYACTFCGDYAVNAEAPRLRRIVIDFWQIKKYRTLFSRSKNAGYFYIVNNYNAVAQLT